ncbi:hypothetical protein QC762_204880 [Podospora pseudocomata]|uniref:Prion-inhibition and propagation HeLo domain-containing protein n=1 Tax=Podospora pseudocomata TaxID=2093779 RepID=A0ABR0GL82_9PEZI|nr:hypothetical protein QC762_204880 [Podospora pseudocomata]
MEAAGLAVGIATLYSTCRDCYNFFTTVNAADKEVSVHLRQTRQNQTKLHNYLLKNRFKAEGVFNILSALADTLSNQEELVRGYEIQFRSTQAIQDGSQLASNVQLAIQDTTIEDIKPVITEFKQRLSKLNKFKWALRDKNDFRKLISDLKSHSESLYCLCPENAFESMNVYFYHGLFGCPGVTEIDKGSSVRPDYELLASAATLKASVNENRDKVRTDDGKLTTIGEEEPEMKFLGKGLALFEGEVVYVEMRDYRGPPLDLTPEQKRKTKRRRILIRNFCNTFWGNNTMKSVYGLNVAGMIDHTEGDHEGHCSILYRLPSMIGIHNRQRPAENLKLRAPVRLKSLLGTRKMDGIRSILGSCFELARSLVRAVCMLHSSGWLHKNIRAESVMFFPKHVSTLQEDRYEIKTEINVSKPILMGYIFSRPDDIKHETRKPSSQKDGLRKAPVDSRNILKHHTTYTWRDTDDSSSKDSEEKHGRVFPRPASIYGRDILNKTKEPEQTKDLNIAGFTLDYYQHPAKHADPQRRYRHAYDVYSLGILLLKVGFWEELKNYEDFRSGYNKIADYDKEDHYERRRWICREYLNRLRWACGDFYADVVLSCLMVDSSDDEVAKESKRKLCARLVTDLENWQA